MTGECDSEEDAKDEGLKLDWKDYVSFVLALLQTTLLPIIILIIILMIFVLLLGKAPLTFYT